MNANQRLNPTPPGYNPLPSPCCSEEFSSEPRLWNVPEPPHQTSSLHMRRHTQRPVRARAHTHALTCKQAHTELRAVPADQRTYITVFVPEWRLFWVTLVLKSLLKHTFTDTTIILTYPHVYSPCWGPNFVDLLNADELLHPKDLYLVFLTILNGRMQRNPAWILSQLSFPSAPNGSR